MIRRVLLLAKRNIKEILRDPVNLFFGLIFPVIFLLILSGINSNASAQSYNPAFSIEVLTPGIATFAPVFMALFSGMLLSKDRTSSFLMRLYTSPATSSDFLFGYTLPMIIISVVQSTITFLVAMVLGFSFTINVIPTIIVIIPITLLYIAIGLLCGCVMSEKAVGGVCGALLTILAGWFAGIWFPLDLIGGMLKTISEILPFYHAAQTAMATLKGDFLDIIPHLSIVVIYDILLFSIAIFIFTKKMKSDNA